MDAETPFVLGPPVLCVLYHPLSGLHIDGVLAIDPTKLTKPRQFARTSQPSRDVDTSLWTETPAERQARVADEVSGKRRRAANADPDLTEEKQLEARKRARYEEEIRRGVDEHTVNTHSSSLITDNTDEVYRRELVARHCSTNTLIRLQKQTRRKTTTSRLPSGIIAEIWLSVVGCWTTRRETSSSRTPVVYQTGLGQERAAVFCDLCVGDVFSTCSLRTYYVIFILSSASSSKRVTALGKLRGEASWSARSLKLQYLKQAHSAYSAIFPFYSHFTEVCPTPHHHGSARRHRVPGSRQPESRPQD